MNTGKKEAHLDRKKKNGNSQRNPLHQLHRALSPHSNNRIPQSLARETGFAVGEVVLWIKSLR
jgi:hypothetical protein